MQAPISNAFIKLLEKEIAPLRQRIAILEAEVEQLKAASNVERPSPFARLFQRKESPNAAP